MTAFVVDTRTLEKWECNSLAEAEAWVDDRLDVDYEGVVGGHYTIDDMDDPDAQE